jgi:hypothetical protein
MAEEQHHPAHPRRRLTEHHQAAQQTAEQHHICQPQLLAATLATLSSARSVSAYLGGTLFSLCVSARALPDEELLVWPTASPEGERNFRGVGQQNEVSTHTHTRTHTHTHTHTHTRSNITTPQQPHTKQAAVSKRLRAVVPLSCSNMFAYIAPPGWIVSISSSSKLHRSILVRRLARRRRTARAPAGLCQGADGV